MVSEPDVTRRFRVTGRVQGVGFRAFVWRIAAELGLRGWVRNRRDGSVEVLAHGSPATLEVLRTALQSGPRWSAVSRVEESETGDESPPVGFELWRDR